MIICKTKEEAKNEMERLHDLLCVDLDCSEWDGVTEDGDTMFSTVEATQMNTVADENYHVIFLQLWAQHHDSFADYYGNMYADIWVITCESFLDAL